MGPDQADQAGAKEEERGRYMGVLERLIPDRWGLLPRVVVAWQIPHFTFCPSQSGFTGQYKRTKKLNQRCGSRGNINRLSHLYKQTLM